DSRPRWRPGGARAETCWSCERAPQTRSPAMLDFSPEAVLVRRKLYVERGYRPVPVDRTGNPVVPVWREQALEDPPRSTVAPVDRNSPVTALLAGELIAVEVASEDPDAVSHL